MDDDRPAASDPTAAHPNRSSPPPGLRIADLVDKHGQPPPKAPRSSRKHLPSSTPPSRPPGRSSSPPVARKPSASRSRPSKPPTLSAHPAAPTDLSKTKLDDGPAYQFAPVMQVVENRDHLEYQLTIREQPKHSRMCGVGEKADRRPIDPSPIIQLRVINHNQLPTPGERPMETSSALPATGDRRSSRRASLVAPLSTSGRRGTPVTTSAGPGWEDKAWYLENPYYFMWASLAHPDTDEELHLLSDGKTRYTTGSSVSCLYHLTDIDGSQQGFFVFPDLSVRVEGTYRLKLSLFETIGRDIHHLKSVYSVPFHVFTAKRFPGMEESTPLSRAFADQGLKVRVRKHPRIRLRDDKGEVITDDDDEDEDDGGGGDMEVEKPPVKKAAKRRKSARSTAALGMSKLQLRASPAPSTSGTSASADRRPNGQGYAPATPATASSSSQRTTPVAAGRPEATAAVEPRWAGSSGGVVVHPPPYGHPPPPPLSHAPVHHRPFHVPVPRSYVGPSQRYEQADRQFSAPHSTYNPEPYYPPSEPFYPPGGPADPHAQPPPPYYRPPAPSHAVWSPSPIRPMAMVAYEHARPPSAPPSMREAPSSMREAPPPSYPSATAAPPHPAYAPAAAAAAAAESPYYPHPHPHHPRPESPYPALPQRPESPYPTRPGSQGSSSSDRYLRAPPPPPPPPLLQRPWSPPPSEPVRRPPPSRLQQTTAPPPPRE